MAEIIKSFIKFSETSGALTFMPVTGTDFLRLDNADGRMFLLIQNNNSQKATITIKAGDGTLAALGDVTVTLNGTGTAVVPFSRVESARVKITEGVNKGNVIINSAVDTGGTLSNVLTALLSVE